MSETIENPVPSLGSHPVETVNETFDSLGLSEPVLKAIAGVGFKHPTPIQSAVIPTSLSGADVIGLAQTGSGKTAAFCIPLSERLLHAEDNNSNSPSGLILCPTREIALQTKAFLDLFGKHHRLETVCIIGGVKMGGQVRDLGKHPDIIVATPGRLYDHMERGNVRLDKVKELVLDEADHMLDMGFLPQIRAILRTLPQERHTVMFSATMPQTIEYLAQQFLRNPKRIDILPQGRAATGISHRVYLVQKEDKKNCLLGLLNQELGSTLVFTRTKIDADWLCRILLKEGHPVSRIHSDLTQQDRTDALAGFRKGEHRILVATGIASRGIDVPNIQHIVNFDIPETVEEYIHRAGRTARGGAIGLVSSIGTWQDKPILREIEETLNQEIPRCSVPGVEADIEIKPVATKPARRNSRRR